MGLIRRFTMFDILVTGTLEHVLSLGPGDEWQTPIGGLKRGEGRSP